MPTSPSIPPASSSPEPGDEVRSFSRMAQTYELHADVQSWLAAELADALPASPPRQVVEVGCGTGLLTGRLVRRWTESDYLATDPSAGMLAAARDRVAGPRVRFRQVDADGLDRRADWIVSSAALHWSRDLARTVEHLWGLVNPGGGLAFGLMLDGTLGEIHSERARLFPGCEPARRLPSMEQILRLRPPGSQRCLEKTLVRATRHASVREMWTAIHRSGVTRGPFSPSPPLSPAQVRGLGEALLARHAREGLLPVTYRMACVVWARPSL